MKPKGVSVEQYRELALAGYTMPEAAEILGVSKTSVQGMAQRHGIEFVKGRSGPRNKHEIHDAITALETFISALQAHLGGKT